MLRKRSCLAVVVAAYAMVLCACSGSSQTTANVGSGQSTTQGASGSGGGSGSQSSSSGNGATSSGGSSGAVSSGGTESGSATSGGGGSSTGASGAAASSGATGSSSGAQASSGTTGASGNPGGDASAGSGAALGSDAGGGSGMDQTPSQPLHVTASPAQYTHGNAGLDTRAPVMAGKLIIDLGVDSGGYISWLGKRGFHVMGVNQVNDCGSVDDWSLGRDYDGDCRLNTLDGMPHGNQSSVTQAQSIMAQVKNTLTTLGGEFPAEDWSYYLNPDGSVRWSDVGFTGMSHGASSAICFASELRLYRAVARAGARDNTCGTGAATGPYNAASPPFNASCPVANIASWLDATFVTPVNRLYALVGTTDVEYGDIMFNMNRIGFVGMPLDISQAQTDLSGSNRYIVGGEGHLDFIEAAANAFANPGNVPNIYNAIDEAFGVPAQDANPSF